VMMLTALVATAIAIATLIVEGGLTAENVQWENLPQVFMLVFGAAHVRYQMLKNQEVGMKVAQVKQTAVNAQEMAGEAMDRSGGPVS
jgi:hypothetical protein